MKILTTVCLSILGIIGTGFAVTSPVLDLYEYDNSLAEDLTLESLLDESGGEIGREIKVVKAPSVPTVTTVAVKVPSIESLSEEEIAVYHLYTVGGTKYDSVESFMGTSTITREQAAKILTNRGKAKDGGLEEKDSVSCDFTDIGVGNIDETLRSYITESCKLGIFRGFAGKFSPLASIKTGDFLLTALRVIGEEVVDDEVYEAAIKRGLISDSAGEFDYNTPITRKDASLILWNATKEISDVTKFLATPTSRISTYTPPAIELPMALSKTSGGFASISADLFGDAGGGELSDVLVTSTTTTTAETASLSVIGSSSRGNSTPLKGGEVNDNVLFEEFVEYYDEAQEKFGEKFTKIFVEERFHLQDVSDSTVLSGVPLNIIDSLGREYLLTLDNAGEYYFYPSSYYTYGEVNQAESYTVSFEYADETYLQVYSHQTDTRELPIVTSARIQKGKTLQLAFLIDTTGSMGDQISKIKNTIQSVSERVKNDNEGVELEYGLVAYKDKRDAYITSAYQFTSDINEYEKRLNNLSASGGGDYEEDMNAGLEEAMEFLDRSQEDQTYGIMFLVADAPPHMDYDQSYDYRVGLLRAVEQGIKIFPVASSGLDNTVGELIFRQIALITNASYVFITKGANGGTDFHVDEQSYSVEQLDDLLVDIILREIE